MTIRNFVQATFTENGIELSDHALTEETMHYVRALRLFGREAAVVVMHRSIQFYVIRHSAV